MNHKTLPSFPYGAVYFRKSNPPREDWERDYQTASEDGMNAFRHWCLWSAVEIAPGEFDWSDYDRQLDLAARNGMKTIIAEMITSAPEWAFRRFAHARFERRDGQKVESGISGSCVIGGLFYLRWRPLLDGPLFGAFGGYGLDGSRTERSKMCSRVAKWVSAPEQENLWHSRPVRGEIGIVYVPETQVFTYAQQGSTNFYAQSMQGAYQGFFDNNIQVDWVHIHHINEYDALYLPFPVMLTQKTADKLREWIASGGALIAEGCPGYWDGHGHVGTVQPNLGLDEVFGVRESYVEFTPDLLGNLKFNFSGIPVWGGLFLQTYQPTTGTPIGWYEDGRIAAVEHRFGKGKTRLIGTMAGTGYFAHETNGSTAFFAEALKFTCVQQHVRCSEPRVKARLHDGSGGTYLWVANPIRRPLPVCLELAESWGPFSSSHSLWGTESSVNGRTVTLTVGARVAVIALK